MENMSISVDLDTRAFDVASDKVLSTLSEINQAQLGVTDFSDETIMALIERMNGATFVPVIVKCVHCGQWCARKTACVHCGAPVD